MENRLKSETHLRRACDWHRRKKRTLSVGTNHQRHLASTRPELLEDSAAARQRCARNSKWP